MRPNIVWIVMDTARADAFEPYGAQAGSSPAVADLARRGTTVEKLRSTASWTLPAHLSMFAGKLPRALGFTDQAGLHPDNARPAVAALEDRMLASVLRRAGYATGAISANLWVSARSGFDVGFDTFVEAVSGRQARMAATKRRDRLAWMWEAAAGRHDDGARSAGQTVHGWVRDLPAQPFFWFVNLLECHSPYLPPRKYGDSWLTRVRAGEDAREYLTQEGVWRVCSTRELPPPDALERMRTLYSGCIRYMDDWLETLLTALDAQGRLDDTLVLITSDHGENFGEGDLLAHALSLDDRLLHVPAIAAGPGAEQLAGLRSVAELPRALATLAEVADHPYRDEDLPPLPVAQYDPPAPPRDDPRTIKVAGEWGLDEEGLARLCSPMVAAADDDLKLVVRDGVERFYSLAADPLEARPLENGALDTAAVQRLRDALTHPAVTEAHTTWSLEEHAPPVAPQDVADLEDRMRLLGYM